MKEYGIIGKTLQHSFSPQYFNNKFISEQINARYSAFELKEIDQIQSLLQEVDLQGFNVTIPFKETIIPYLDGLDSSAAEAGAVNCVQMHKGKRLGFNTDVMGFQQSLQKLLQPYHSTALILGTGGAAKGVQVALKNLSIPFKVVSRNEPENTLSYHTLNESIIKEHSLIINTTPLGTSPNVDDKPPIPYQFLEPKHLLFDLVYNPEETAFMKSGIAMGAQAKNGLEMLHLQADASWEIWNK